MKDKKMINIRGLKTLDHITLRIKRSDLKHFPKTFYINFTIDDIRDGEIRDNVKGRY